MPADIVPKSIRDHKDAKIDSTQNVGVYRPGIELSALNDGPLVLVSVEKGLKLEVPARRTFLA